MNFKPFASTLLTGVLALSSALLFEGCAKKVAAVKPAQAPAPVAQTAPAPVTAERPAPAAPAIVAETNRPDTSGRATPDQATKDKIQALLDRIQDAYFDYNTSNIRADAKEALHADAVTLSEIVRGYPNYKLTIQGFADERGSAEYNLALGEARAKRAQQFLIDSGIPEAQLPTMSFGKERPVCTEQTEECWQKNRRIHITQAQAE